MAEKTRVSTHITCFAGRCSAVISFCTLRRLRSIPDASKRLRTLATEQHGTVATLALISILATARSWFYHQTHRTNAQITRNSRDCETKNARKIRHTRASSPRVRPTLCDTISPSEWKKGSPRHTGLKANELPPAHYKMGLPELIL